MTRIAFIIPTLDQSGAERQLTLLATGLPRDLYEIKVIALNRGGPFAEQLRDAGISVEVLGKRFRFDPLTWLRLRSSLQAFRPDIVQSFLFAANSYVRLPGILPKNCRVIVSERCVDSWKSGWQLALDRQLIRRTNAMTANSASVADFYMGVGVPRELITVIPNAMPNLPSDYSRDEALQRLGLQPHHRIVGFAGRLAPQKRLKDLMWGFQLLHQLVDDVRLVLIGEGPDRDALAELAQSFGCREKIVFAGHRPDAYSLMSAFEVFVLASEFEGMSNSLMEAMSLGIPCVVSDIAANRELITDEQTGLLFPLGKGPDLAKTMARCLQNTDLAGELGQRGRQFILNHHSVEQLVAKHEELYRRWIPSQ
jgi:glycosyltransferase involved in cell wall biosynthesis